LEFLLEIILNFLGLVIGLVIAAMSYVGYKNTGSPTLFRLSIAFFAIGVGFGILAVGYVIDDTILQAFSHTIKSFFPKSRYFRSIGIMPLFLVSFVSVEYVLRAVSFILLVYGSIETMLSYLNGKKSGTLFVAIGLGLLALGEFVGWYSFVFPETIMYSISICVKIGGLISLGIPITKIPLRKITFDDSSQ